MRTKGAAKRMVNYDEDDKKAPSQPGEAGTSKVEETEAGNPELDSSSSSDRSFSPELGGTPEPRPKKISSTRMRLLPPGTDMSAQSSGMVNYDEDDKKAPSQPGEAGTSKVKETEAGNPELDSSSSSDRSFSPELGGTPEPRPKKISSTRMRLLPPGTDMSAQSSGTIEKLIGSQDGASTSEAAEIDSAEIAAEVEAVRAVVAVDSDTEDSNESSIYDPPVKREASFSPEFGYSGEPVRPAKRMRLLPIEDMEPEHRGPTTPSPVPSGDDESPRSPEDEPEPENEPEPQPAELEPAEPEPEPEPETQESRESREWPCIKSAVRKILHTSEVRTRVLVTPEPATSPASPEPASEEPNPNPVVVKDDENKTDSATDSSASSRMTSISVGSVSSCPSSDGGSGDEQPTSSGQNVDLE